MSIAHFHPPAPDADELSSTIAELLHQARQAFDRDLDVTRDRIARILVLMSSDGEVEQHAMPAEARATGGLAPWQIRRVVAYIDANLAVDLSNEMLADLIQLSRSHFCAAFRRSLGISPRNFIIERRVARAAQLMLGGDASLADIAGVCGFSDQAHFSRLFRRSRGETPSRWRRLRQMGPSGR
ncbi:helix-turn-helix domain-containing protein [Azospirillum sp. B4]|uniref:helix-turn-helix domain-containing protein n=1 Tax=Azospirillum sp. B4 TaxID=95605 RepID=UPI0003478CBB|nr:AraC family transcriptional regulator [Azospirillum sp. B4]